MASLLAMLAAAGVFWALPELLSLGAATAVIFVPMIPIVIGARRGYQDHANC